MNRTCSSAIFLAILLGTMPLRSQEPIEGSNVFGDLSAERMKPIFESRKLAQRELDGDSAAFSAPNIAGPIEWPTYLIAIARITAVQFPTDATPRSTISFHV
jgi:hypothetical protein